MAPSMRVRTLCCAAALVWLACFQGLQAQQTSVGPAALTPVPRLVWFGGAFRPADGLPIAPVEAVTLAVYSDQQGGNLLWQETQNVVVGADGRYNLLMGSTLAEGLPLDLFTTGEPRWLGVRFNRSGEVEQPRVHLASVPYALKAVDADTLGGKPASAYLLAPTGAAGVSDTATAAGASTTSTGHPPSHPTPAGATATSPGPTPANVVLPGTANVVAKYANSADVGPSALYEAGGLVGVNTTTPLDALHVQFTNTNGAMTGLAVQNLGNTATSYSGTLFYDQNGALGQFQGFNNVTHEYRINNIAQASGQFNGSINFMIGGTSRFFVSPANIGIGTTAPFGELDVSNALNPGHAAAILAVTSFGSNGFPSTILARKARGTVGAPSAVLNGDTLASWFIQGYGATGFSSNSSGISVNAAENWTDAAQGTFMNFSTTTVGTNLPLVRMTVNSNGNVGLGTTTPQANLDVINAPGAPAVIMATTYAPSGSGTIFMGRKARGTAGAPSAVLNGDMLSTFSARGYGATGFNFAGGVGGMGVNAAEDWTDTAQGTRINFFTTPTGTTVPQTRVSIDPFGNVGIGTTGPNNTLELVRSGTNTTILGTSFGGVPGLFFRAARGTAQTPTAVQAADVIGFVGGNGYGATTFGNVSAVVGMVAAENWTDTAHGSAIGLLTTPLGSTTTTLHMAVLPSGNVAIDTPLDVNGFLTAADKLQVFGDIRVGTTGTEGCIKNFAGTGIIGTCASDRRFKQRITPFGPALDRVAALQPVHFFWRAAEFPDRHFGDSRAYGLIAQDVEQVLPELVVTNDDGFKAVDYSKLPLLTIEAVKELKAENETLKQRLTELERLIMAMRPTSSHP